MRRRDALHGLRPVHRDARRARGEAEDEDDALNKVEGHASLCASCATELDLSPDANWEDATAEEEMA